MLFFGAVKLAAGTGNHRSGAFLTSLSRLGAQSHGLARQMSQQIVQASGRMLNAKNVEALMSFDKQSYLPVYRAQESLPQSQHKDTGEYVRNYL